MSAADPRTCRCRRPAASEEEEWIPHCFVKQNKSREFIGCTSMSEAFHRLDLARAVVDVRRFNYVCKVVHILVNEKLQNLSATARKHLFAIIQAIVIHSKFRPWPTGLCPRRPFRKPSDAAERPNAS